MPSIPKDIDKLLKNVNFFFRFLPIKNIYIAAPENIRDRIEQEHDERLIFVDENEFVNVKGIKELFFSRTHKDLRRAGWYIQQFIKMQFARFTQDKYYLIWDSDTIPITHINMFSEDSLKPCFDMRSYGLEPIHFEIISKILPDTHRVCKDSFISEHMLVISDYMREMLDKIESNNEIEGRNFQEKIINAIKPEDLWQTSFSEFETYGSYVMLHHPNSYVFREWRALRGSIKFYSDAGQIDERQIKWLSRCYDAVSIEKWQNYSFFAPLVQSRLFQARYSPDVLEKIESSFVGRALTGLKRVARRYYYFFKGRKVH